MRTIVLAVGGFVIFGSVIGYLLFLGWAIIQAATAWGLWAIAPAAAVVVSHLLLARLVDTRRTQGPR